MGIKAIEFYENGNVKRIEFEAEQKQYVFPYGAPVPYQLPPPYQVWSGGSTTGSTDNIKIGGLTEESKSASMPASYGGTALLNKIIETWNTPEEQYAWSGL